VLLLKQQGRYNEKQSKDTATHAVCRLVRTSGWYCPSGDAGKALVTLAVDTVNDCKLGDWAEISMNMYVLSTIKSIQW